MPDVRYVCLSDLHFGAQNSLLTNLSGIEADPMSPSSTLSDLVDCLEALIRSNEDPTVKPVLVLNGDAVDFALASDEVAVMAFEQFIRLAFAERDLFSHTVQYLPGNHDHHLWETARERQYAAYVSRHPPGERLAAPWHATSMLPSVNASTRVARAVEADTLQMVMQRFPNLRDVHVEVHYPSFGIVSAAGRAAVFNHGHYIDSLYQLMSRLKAVLFPGSEPAATAWELEAENFAWIDFFWSTLGRSGDWGADVTVLYDMLQDDRAVTALADNLAAAALASGKRRVVPAFLRRRIASQVAGQVGKRIVNLERHASDSVPLSAAGTLGLARYIEGPLVRQFALDRPGKLPDKITFVFGHTHKPFEARRQFAGYPHPLDIYNTGGWVVDSIRADAMTGAAVVLFDEDLNPASVRLFSQGAGPAAAAVQVRTPPEDAPGANPFAKRLRQVIDPTVTPWSDFTTRIGPVLSTRRRTLEAMIAAGTAAARARPTPTVGGTRPRA